MKVSRLGYLVLFAIAMLLAFCSVTALAQSSSGTVTGEVTDQQGADAHRAEHPTSRQDWSPSLLPTNLVHDSTSPKTGEY